MVEISLSCASFALDILEVKVSQSELSASKLLEKLISSTTVCADKKEQLSKQSTEDRMIRNKGLSGCIFKYTDRILTMRLPINS
ncbi:MAG TPA: hypothetical protein DCG19_09410 [Cryomorphaceae bacterium]|nr:hypothetical protein [Owenweeksia sp.]MBF99128.1 hypothetical protein [Owenweeksia sp.]HAD97612.1 hypothetical protein [Cryomorphaceae bacterium]HBF18916.1 hypothetical protein [Cryomorphaceae bacterium]HCQ16777.1 hypothetical protein [Cryomorphaceae bacterium]|tara:strand:+ start:450 stop:701 length:252 start_codon:yes stop_codon:yes gene_type:complete